MSEQVDITKMGSKNSKLEPEVTIELGGETRTLRVDFNTLALIEERTGKTVQQMSDWKSIKSKELRSIIWACLVDSDPSLTEQQVGRWLTLQVFPKAVQAFSEAMFISMKGEAPSPDAIKNLAKGIDEKSPLALVEAQAD